MGPRARPWLVVATLAVTLFAVGSWVFASPATAATPAGPAAAVTAVAPVGPSQTSWSPSQLSGADQVAAPYSEQGLALPGSVLRAPLAVGQDPSSDLQVLVSLELSNQSELRTVLAQLQDPHSSAYHRYLSAAQFDAEFGAPASVYTSLVNYVEGEGATDVVAHPDRLSLGFVLSPAVAQRLFHTTIAAYTSSSGEPYFAPETYPEIPGPLAPYIADVQGLSNFSQYTNHIAPLLRGPIGQVAQALGTVDAGRISGQLSAPPGSASNPFNSTVPSTHNPGGLRYPAPVNKNVSGQPTKSCATTTCADLVPLTDLQVTYNLTGEYQKFGYPVNATVASILWSDTACRSNGGACKANGYTNYWCAQQGFGVSTSAWDFYMPDVTSTWNYTLPSGEPMPTAYSMAVAGPTYGYPSGSQGFSASCDNGGAEAENTLDVIALGSLLPGANVFQVFDGTGGTSAGLATSFSDILSPSLAAFSPSGGFDTAASIAKLQNVSVITNSWGGAAPTGSTLTTWTNDLAQAAARGITVVGSTGDGTATIGFPTDFGGNALGTVGIGGTTAAINRTTLLRGSPHYATGGGTPGGKAPFDGVGTGEIGWYEPAGTVFGFGTTLGSTEGVANGSSYWRPSWANGSADALSVANAVRPGNFRFEADLAAVANDTPIDLSFGPYSFNITCLVAPNCTKISSRNIGTSSGSSPTVGWTYMVGTSIADQIAGAEIAVIDHSLYAAPGSVCEGYWATLGSCTGHATHQGWIGFGEPAIYAMGQLAYLGDLTLRSFYDVTLYTGGGGNASVYQAKTGYDLATGWGVIDVGNYTQNTLTYPVTFTESGLPGGARWSVRLTPTLGDAGCTVSGSSCTNGLTTSRPVSSISFNETYGSYTYTIGPIAGYLASPRSGSVSIDGANATVAVTFTPNTYPVRFTEAGLPDGTSWTVTLAGTPVAGTGNLVSFAEPNGSFGYVVSPIAGFTVSPRTGSVTVAAAGVTVSVTFARVTYPVTFSVSGLPAGTRWTVDVAGIAENSSSGELSLAEPNGSFAFNVTPIAGYTVSPASGTVTVAGANSSVVLVFTLVTYTVRFVASGLASGTSWAVTLAGVTTSGAGSALSYTEPNGSYPFSVAAIPGYLRSPASGVLNVAGADAVVNVTFARVLYSVVVTESGLPAGTNWTTTVAGTLRSSTGTTLVFSEANGSYSYAVAEIPGYAVLPRSGSLTVAGANASLSVVFTRVTYSVTFLETGLAASTPWTVVLGGSAVTANASSAVFVRPNGTLGYSVDPIPGYTVSPPSGSVTIDGANVTVPIVFEPVTYTVTFVETGLTTGTSWTVVLGGVSESSVSAGAVFVEPNGTFPYSVNPIPGYTVNPSAGSARVNGTNLTIGLAFAQVSYALVFSESGLPTGANWSVTLAGSARSTVGTALEFSEPNGTFRYSVTPIAGYAVSPHAGSVEVNGSNLSVVLTFARVTYAVTFSESGLPFGTPWSVSLGGISGSTSLTTIGFLESNGSYPYSVGAVPGYTVGPPSGTVLVNDSGATVLLSFTEVTYAVTFTESGLSAGTSWSVTLAGAKGSSTSAAIALSEPNGSFPFTVAPLPGYTVSPASGTASVSGANVSVIVSFARVTYSIAFVESGLTGGTVWSVTLGGLTAGTNTTALGFTEPNGSYAFSVTSIAGYTVGPRSGAAVVNGSNVSILLVYTPVRYPVSFSEIGLPVGASWTVTFDGTSLSSSASSVSTDATNGSYGYAVAPVGGFTVAPAAGTVSVQGSGVAVSVTFTPVSYAVQFTESGLLTGSSWSVILGGVAAASSSLTVAFTEPNGSYAFSVGPLGGYTVAPRSGLVTVNGSAVSVAVTFLPVTYSVGFIEGGLAPGSSWTVTLDGASLSASGTALSFVEPNGSYGWSLVPIPGYTAAPPSGSVLVNGSNASVSVVFRAVSYSVAFEETGLGTGVSWSVSLGGTPLGSNGSSIGFSVTNGTFAFVVAPIAGYTVLPSSGTVVVAGANRSIAIAFTPVTYAVTFLETGLPAGTVWSVSLGLATESIDLSSLSFSRPNGSYPFSVSPIPGYRVAPPAGSVAVVGQTVSVALAFTAVTFSVRFSEAGLAVGTVWTVSVDGSTLSATNASQEVALPNGTYPYLVSPIPGFTVAPASGTVTVAGANTTVELTFTVVTYPVSFRETGLPNGSSWSVTFDGMVRTSNTSAIGFAAANGSYAYSIGSFQGYTLDVSSGTVSVAGAARVVNATFHRVVYSVSFTETGLPSGTLWSVNVTSVGPSSTNGSVIGLELPNGSYAFSVNSADLRYTASGGTFVVQGGAVALLLSFRAVTFSVTFTETGLPAGTPWSLNVSNGDGSSTRASSVVLNETNGSYSYRIESSDARYRASGGTFTVAGTPVSVGVAFAPVTFAVRVNESGLPNGTLWFVNLSGGVSYSSTTPLVGWNATNGSYTFSVAALDARYGAAGGTFVIDGAGVSVAVVFALHTYAVEFTESGLPNGTLWYANISGGGSFSSFTNTVIFVEPNGSYSYAFSFAGPYAPRPEGGTIAVRGAPALGSTVYVPVLFAVTFNESGLPAGTSWSVDLSGVGAFSTTAASLAVLVPNGTYDFAVAPVPGFTVTPRTGAVAVNGGAPAAVPIGFHPVTYSVRFDESGLPGGAAWSVDVNGTEYTSNRSILNASRVANGSYTFSVGPVAGFTVSPSDGWVFVSGSAVLVNLTFTQVNYTIRFSENGLPAGTNWTVSLNGVPLGMIGTVVRFSEPNGTYAFVVTPLPDYSVSPQSGTVTVNGADLTVNLTFLFVVPANYTVAFEEIGLPNGTSWSVSFNATSASSTNGSIDFVAINGIYAYSVGAVSGFQQHPSSGLVGVNGANVTVRVLFSLVHTSLSFTELGGLPAGKSWRVVVDGSSAATLGPTLTFALPNGSYTYLIQGPGGREVSGAAPGGDVSVHGPTTISFVFVKGPTHTVVFREKGLAKTGKHSVQPWCVVLDGWQLCSTTVTLSFANLTPGAYDYQVVPLRGQTITEKVGKRFVGESGSVSVGRARGTAVALTYDYPYAVTFNETGLPANSSWSVTVRGVTHTSTGSSLVFEEPNGSYGYKIPVVTGYRSSGHPRPVGVHGAPTVVTVRFTHLTAPVRVAVLVLSSPHENGVAGPPRSAVPWGGGFSGFAALAAVFRRRPAR